LSATDPEVKVEVWTALSADQFRALLDRAQEVLAFAAASDVPLFATALAGVAVIRRLCRSGRANPRWWVEVITSTDENPFEKYFTDAVPPGWRGTSSKG